MAFPLSVFQLCKNRHFPVVQKRQQSSYSRGYFVVLEADKDGGAGQQGGEEPEGVWEWGSIGWGEGRRGGGSRFLSLLKWARVSSLAPDKPNVDRVDKLILTLLVSFGPKNDLVAEVLRSYWPIGHVSFMSHHLLYFQGWMRRIQVVTQTLRDTILCCVHKSTKYPVYLE